MASQPKPDTKPQHDDFTEEELSKQVTLEINGKPVVKTLKEAITIAQKKEAAEQRFAEAVQKERDAEEAILVRQDLIEGFTKRDQAKLKRAFQNSGLSKDEVEALFASPQQGTAEITETSEEDADPRIVQLQAEVQQLKDAYNNAQTQSRQRTIQAHIDQAIDSDDGLSNILSGCTTPDDRDFVREVVRTSVAKASETLPWPKALQSGLNTARQRLSNLRAKPGASDSDADAPDADEETTPDDWGAPSTGGAVSRLHQSPTSVKRVSVTDKNYVQNFAQRLQNLVRRSKR